jgi:hypothetical protein
VAKIIGLLAFLAILIIPPFFFGSYITNDSNNMKPITNWVLGFWMEVFVIVGILGVIYLFYVCWFKFSGVCTSKKDLLLEDAI